MDLIETISCVGVTRHIPVNSRVARESFWQGPQDQMECGSKKEREKKEKEEKRKNEKLSGSTKESNVEQLQTIHEKAAKWARRTGSVFAPQKYELIHFAKGIKDQEVEAPLDLPTAKLWPEKTAKLLGVILDKELSGLPHAEHLRRKADTSIRGMKAIGGSTWGINLQHGVQLYKATILPKIAYASSTWFRSNPKHGQKGATGKALTILQSIQKDALRIATGAWKNTALAAMEIETNTTPIDLYLQQRNENALHRIRGSPMYNTITSNRATQDKRKWRRKPPLRSLEELHITSNRTTGQPRKRRWNRCIQTPRVRGGNLQRHTRLAQKRQR
jgi:hypothetical protein